MTLLLAGLVVFLGMHSVRIVAEPLRGSAVSRLGLPAWRALYSLVSIAGFLLIIKGYGEARAASAVLYELPYWSRYVAVALMLPALVLFLCAYIPGTHIRRLVGHPMMLSVRIWAAAHLLANGRLVDVLLFGSFFAWAVFAHHAARRRDRLAGTPRPEAVFQRDLFAIAGGLLLWLSIILWLHQYVGVVPLLPPGTGMKF